MGHGIEYSYYGKDKYDHSLDKIFTQREFVQFGKFEDGEKNVENPQEAALLALASSFGNINPSADDLTLDVFYDFKTDCWVVEPQAIPFSLTEEEIDGVPVLIIKGLSSIMEGDEIITVNRRNGVITSYSTFLLGPIHRPVQTMICDYSENDIIEADLAGFKITWNGDEYKPEMPLVAIDGRTYIPLREFANKAELLVDWDEIEKTITIDRF